ncbi:MAG TPA: multicopper oxidase domain-containing protein [Candidatus Sulfotelmatobacter sp.]|nr:multicopper oxidase domain-containing protein [Candidatus Sulfotelmatobacter sp.]
MGLTRRTFLQASGAIGISAALHQSGSHAPAPKFRTQLQANSLTQFVDPLPIPEIARPSGTRPSPLDPSVKIPYYRIPMRQFEAKLHRDLKPTRQWGYGGMCPGPTFETRSGQGALVEWANELPTSHFLPIDHNIHGAESDKPDVRAVVHLHGGKTPADSDGYPESWFVPGKSAIYHYPSRQDAAMLWYHDHALGINRLNVFAGLLGAFFVRDEFEDSLGLPRDKFEVPLVIYDRVLDLESQLNYPVSPDPKKPWVPEVFGDAMVVNGKIFPYLEVEPGKYRFRVLNGSNGRFLHLSVSDAHSFHQIGTDQGLLPSPVQQDKVYLAPGERADLVIDFAGLGGSNLALRNDIFSILQFRVGKSSVHDTSTLPQTLRPVARIAESSAIKTRSLSLVEVDDPKQRPLRMLLNNTHWNMPVTENPMLDSTEIWELVNTTNDSHPIHLHLVRFQVLDRRTFDIDTYWTANKVRYKAPAVPPIPAEMGWKDTVRADPGMVTRIIAKFEGFPGRYVWHCHILEHEDNEMMRPFDVLPAK